MQNDLRFFNVVAHRPQKKMDKRIAKNLAINTLGNDPAIYGYNGNVRGWIIGELVQMSKECPKGANNKFQV